MKPSEWIAKQAGEECKRMSKDDSVYIVHSPCGDGHVYKALFDYLDKYGVEPEE